MNTKEKESRRLRSIKKDLEDLGWYVVLSRASLGPFDLVAIASVGVVLIQVKCNSDPGPDEVETISNFRTCPVGTLKQVWRFNDRKKDPIVTTYA